MKKNFKSKNTRKTIYIKTVTSEKIDQLAKLDNRTFSSWVSLLLDKMIQKGVLLDEI